MEDKKINVFKNKNFILLFQGALTSNIAGTLYSFAMSFYILKITDNNALIQGIYLAMCSLVFIIFSLIGGIIADRMDKVKIVYGTDFIKGIFIIFSLLPLIFALNNESITLQVVILFIVGFVNNLLSAIFVPASGALLPELLCEDELQQANSFFTVQTSFVGILGVILGSVLYSLISIKLLFLLIGVLYIASGISEMFIKNKKKLTKDEKLTLKVMKDDCLEAFKYLKSLKGLLACIFGFVFINFFFTMIDGNIFPYIINTDVAGSDYLGKGFFEAPTWAAIISVFFSLGSIVMGIIFGKKKQKEHYGSNIKGATLLVSLSTIILCLIYVFTKRVDINIFLLSCIACMFINGIAIILINVPISIIMQVSIPQDRLAKVSSFISILAQGLCPLASLLGGILITFLGVNGILLFCIAGFAVVSLYICLNKEINML